MVAVKENNVTPPGPAPPAAGRRSQAERRAATRQALMDAARALFAERGFAGVGREEIVRRAGVTRGAMYHYFASKEELFRAVYEAVERDLLDSVAVAAVRDPDPVQQLRLGTRAFLDAAGTEEVRRISLLDAPAVLDPSVRKELSSQYGLGLVTEALRAVAAAGRLSVGTPASLAPILLAAMHEAATRIADGEPADQLIEVMDELIVRVTSGPGRI